MLTVFVAALLGLLTLLLWKRLQNLELSMNCLRRQFTVKTREFVRSLAAVHNYNFTSHSPEKCDGIDEFDIFTEEGELILGIIYHWGKAGNSKIRLVMRSIDGREEPTLRKQFELTDLALVLETAKNHMEKLNSAQERTSSEN